MTIRLTALAAVIAMLCFACNGNSESASSVTKDDVEFDKRLESTADFKLTDSTYQEQSSPEKEKKEQNGLPQKPVDWEKKIVKTANLNAEVKDYKSFSLQLNEKVKKYGGYISQEEQVQSEYKIENTVIIKVPVDQFANVVNDLTKDISKLNEKRINSEDVTTQLIDGKSRLEAKKQVRLKYLDLLKQAKNMEEILTVQREINEIQEDIELVNGRINTLSLQSAMSTINFTFFQIIDPNAKDGIENKPGFLDEVKAAFANGWNWIGELFVGLVSVWPLILVILFGIWFFKKRLTPAVNKSIKTEIQIQETKQ